MPARSFPILAAVVLSLAGQSAAQDGAVVGRPYDSIQAGYDAYRLAEERRRADLAHQIYVNDQVRYWAGLPTTRGETVYYYDVGGPASYAGAAFYGAATPLLPPATLEYTYAYGRRGLLGRYRGSLTVFESWPFVPDDLYGYRYYTPVRQPIGQHQEQTGPDRWESHPVYDPPLTRYRALPPVDSPLLDGTPYESPRVEPELLPEEVAPDAELPPDPPAPAPSAPPRRVPREY
jgi:hypothetical protein